MNDFSFGLRLISIKCEATFANPKAEQAARVFRKQEARGAIKATSGKMIGYTNRLMELIIVPVVHEMCMKPLTLCESLSMP